MFYCAPDGSSVTKEDIYLIKSGKIFTYSIAICFQVNGVEIIKPAVPQKNVTLRTQAVVVTSKCYFKSGTFVLQKAP